jgi:hypothetical protein
MALPSTNRIAGRFFMTNAMLAANMHVILAARSFREQQRFQGTSC